MAGVFTLMTPVRALSDFAAVRPAAVKRLLILAVFLTTFSLLMFYGQTSWDTGSSYVTEHLLAPEIPEGASAPPLEVLAGWEKQVAAHPIDALIRDAREYRDKLLAKRSRDVKTAAQRYRERRNRHPPPGFDAWMRYARQHDAIIVEEFFDRIYDDLGPFEGLEPKEIRKRGAPVAHETVISVRDGKVTVKADGDDPASWMAHWTKMFEDLKGNLPDVDIPLNTMDEPRLLVPWKDINDLMTSKAALPWDPSNVRNIHQNWPKLGRPNDTIPEGQEFDQAWVREGSNMYWNWVSPTCPPHTPGADTIAIHVVNDPPSMPKHWPLHSYYGYVTNWTEAGDVCNHPYLRSLHGSFIEPVSMRTSQKLMPLFGGSKLFRNNDILIPPPMYLSTDELYAGKGTTGPAWQKKRTGMVWRGVASGGRNKFDTWTHFQRHRFMQMMNATAIRMINSGDLILGANLTFDLDVQDKYELITSTAQEGWRIPLDEWIESQDIDIAFTHLECFPAPPPPMDYICDYTNAFFEPRKGIPMEKQYNYRFLPDIDGNSYSGRFLAFLKSTSLPIKASIYAEWHDSRLLPWVHFVPFHNSFVDIYSVYDFLVAEETITASHNEWLEKTEGKKAVAGEGRRKSVGETIALEGQDWARKALRREDMLLYTWRLILEFARLSSDERQSLGYVADLK